MSINLTRFKKFRLIIIFLSLSFILSASFMSNSGTEQQKNININDNEIILEKNFDDFLELSNIEVVKDFININYEKSNIVNENYAIKGFIKNNASDEPINNARIFALNYDSNNLIFDVINTTSNSDGFYILNLNFSYSSIFVQSDGFYGNGSYYSYIGETIAWMNFSLDYGRPQESSIINGYIRDLMTNQPIHDAIILHYLIDLNMTGGISFNYTRSNESGYYLINTSPGYISSLVMANGYTSIRL